MDLPVEVIQHICCFLSPCEIVRLRKVSKQFRDITRSSALWRERYANVHLLLPPGPFSWQSARYLERTLVQSELVSKTWSLQPLKVLSRTLGSWKHKRSFSWIIAFGRWYIFLQGKTIQCHDIDMNALHLLYDGTTHSEFAFTACTATDVNDRRVYLLLVDFNFPHELTKLLEFHVDNENFSKPEILDLIHARIPQKTNLKSDCYLTLTRYYFHGSTPFLALQQLEPRLIFDVRTRIYYTFPTSHSALIQNESQGYAEFMTTQILLTKTHVIAVRTFDGFADIPIIVQAFVVPDLTVSRNSDVGTLRLTHEVAISTTPSWHAFSLLRNSVVGPTTGSVNIKLLHIIPSVQMDNCPKRISCLDLTLPEPVSTTDILPITFGIQHLFESVWFSECYTASDNGYVRGLLLMRSSVLLPLFRHVISARKFTINASGDECTMTCCDPCPIDLPEDEVTFDGMRGRVHYFQDVNATDSGRRIVTVDLA